MDLRPAPKRVAGRLRRYATAVETTSYILRGPDFVRLRLRLASLWRALRLQRLDQKPLVIDYTTGRPTSPDATAWPSDEPGADFVNFCLYAVSTAVVHARRAAYYLSESETAVAVTALRANADLIDTLSERDDRRRAAVRVNLQAVAEGDREYELARVSGRPLRPGLMGWTFGRDLLGGQRPRSDWSGVDLPSPAVREDWIGRAELLVIAGGGEDLADSLTEFGMRCPTLNPAVFDWHAAANADRRCYGLLYNWHSLARHGRERAADVERQAMAEYPPTAAAMERFRAAYLAPLLDRLSMPRAGLLNADELMQLGVQLRWLAIAARAFHPPGSGSTNISAEPTIAEVVAAVRVLDRWFVDRVAAASAADQSPPPNPSVDPPGSGGPPVRVVVERIIEPVTVVAAPAAERDASDWVAPSVIAEELGVPTSTVTRQAKPGKRRPARIRSNGIKGSGMLVSRRSTMEWWESRPKSATPRKGSVQPAGKVQPKKPRPSQWKCNRCKVVGGAGEGRCQSCGRDEGWALVLPSDQPEPRNEPRNGPGNGTQPRAR